MPRYAIVENNTIVNVIVADANFVAEHCVGAIETLGNFGVGDQYVNGEFVKVINLVSDDEPIA